MKQQHQSELILGGLAVIIAAVAVTALIVNDKHTATPTTNKLPNITRTAKQSKQDTHGYTTQTFTTTSNQWGFFWSYNCNGVNTQYQTVDMTIDNPYNNTANDANDTSTVIVTNLREYPQESGYEQATKAGTFKISVATECAWTLQVLNHAPTTSSTLPSDDGIQP